LWRFFLYSPNVFVFLLFAAAAKTRATATEERSYVLPAKPQPKTNQTQPVDLLSSA